MVTIMGFCFKSGFPTDSLTAGLSVLEENICCWGPLLFLVPPQTLAAGDGQQPVFIWLPA